MTDDTPTTPLPQNNGSDTVPLQRTDAVGNTQEPYVPDEATPFWRKPVGRGVAVGLALLLVGGAGAAIALGVANNQAPETQPNVTAAPAPTVDQSAASPDSATPAPSASADGEFVAADADALSRAITLAVEAAGGEGATEVEVQRGGWKVEVQRADGTEVEVLVAADGATSIREEDDDDRDPLIDSNQLPEIVRIALEAAGGGTIEKLSTEDDDDHLYDIDVRLSDGSEVEVKLDAALNVVSIDFD